jgi:hypothetical protein
VDGTSEGTVTVTGISANEVDVLITLAPNLVINTSNGNSHTPVAFNLTSTLAAAVGTGNGITVLHPVGTTECFPATQLPCFTPQYGASPITGSVDLNEGLLYSGSNGASGGNDGPVEFTITATGIGNISNGQFSAFVPGSNGAIFAVDLFLSLNGPAGDQWGHHRHLCGHRRQRQHLRGHTALRRWCAGTGNHWPARHYRVRAATPRQKTNRETEIKMALLHGGGAAPSIYKGRNPAGRAIPPACASRLPNALISLIPDRWFAPIRSRSVRQFVDFQHPPDLAHEPVRYGERGSVR